MSYLLYRRVEVRVSFVLAFDKKVLLHLKFTILYFDVSFFHLISECFMFLVSGHLQLLHVTQVC